MYKACTYTYIFTFLEYLLSSLFAFYTFVPAGRGYILPNILDHYSVTSTALNLLRLLTVIATVLGCPLTIFAATGVLMTVTSTVLSTMFSSSELACVECVDAVGKKKPETQSREPQSGEHEAVYLQCPHGVSPVGEKLVRVFCCLALVATTTGLALACPSIQVVFSWTGSCATILVAYFLPSLFFILANGEGREEEQERETEWLLRTSNDVVEEKAGVRAGRKGVPSNPLVPLEETRKRNHQEMTSGQRTTTAHSAQLNLKHKMPLLLYVGKGYDISKYRLAVGMFWCSGVLMFLCIANKVSRFFVTVD